MDTFEMGSWRGEGELHNIAAGSRMVWRYRDVLVVEQQWMLGFEGKCFLRSSCCEKGLFSSQSGGVGNWKCRVCKTPSWHKAGLSRFAAFQSGDLIEREVEKVERWCDEAIKDPLEATLALADFQSCLAMTGNYERRYFEAKARNADARRAAH